MQCNAGDDDEHSQSEITTTIILEQKKEKDYKKSHKSICISEIKLRKATILINRQEEMREKERALF